MDAKTGSVMDVHKHQKAGPLFVSRDAYERRPGASWDGFPVEVFTDALLSRLRELRADELFSAPGASKIAELTASLRDVERLLAVALAKHEADPESPTWQAQVDEHDRQKRRLVAELAAARQEAASPLSANWVEAVALMNRDEPERLRAALARVVEEIRMLVVSRSMCKIAAAQVRFHGGGCGR